MDIALAKEILEAAELSRKIDAGLTNVKLEGLPRFDMSNWVQTHELPEESNAYPPPRVPIAGIREGTCGTAACLAGYAVLLRAPAGATTDGENIYDEFGYDIGEFAWFAQRELQVTRDQGEALFYTGNDLAINRLRYLIDHPDVSGEELRDRFPAWVE